MPYVIGTDEAGYGPNLGPLVVSATLWEVPDEFAEESTWSNLEPELSANCSRRDSSKSLLIADSKEVYKPGGTLRNLELPSLAIWRTTSPCDFQLDAFLNDLTNEYGESLQNEFWWQNLPNDWPIDVEQKEVDEWTNRIQNRFDESRIRCLGIRSAAVTSPHFNDLLKSKGNKANLLTDVTLVLVRELLEGVGDEPIAILCDRHGGRTKYRAALQRVFEDSLIMVDSEQSHESRYSWKNGRANVCCRFETGGEKHLPVAMASMISKYIREVAMISFNAFWKAEVPDLKPTAGYPVDAKRFRKDIESARERLGIDMHQLWRSR